MAGYWPRTETLIATRRVLVGLAIAGAGGAVFTWFGMPAAWLSGSTLVVAIATLCGLRFAMPNRLRDVIFALLGISMGAGVTPDTMARLPDWPLSLATLAVTVIAIIAAVKLYFQRFAGWDPMTAMFASIPGAMSYVMALAVETDADIRKVALAQCLRLIVLVMVLPLVLVHVGIETPPPLGTGTAPLADLGILLVAGVAGAVAMAWLNIPGGAMNGAFLVSAILHGSGVVQVNLPVWLLAPCFCATGLIIGSRFEGTDLKLLRETFLTSLGGLLVGSLVAMCGAVAVVVIARVPLPQAVLAFAPGALEAMTGMALLLGADPAYVAGHQLFRFFGMALTMPAFLSWYERGHRTGK